MVKANAYGCDLSMVVPELDGHVDAFGVASLEEALVIRALGSRCPCVLLGVFSPEELAIAARHDFECVIHQRQQLNWILTTPLSKKLKVWVKVNTGMNRLGFEVHETANLLSALMACPWVDDELRVMSHLAMADEPMQPENHQQWQAFNQIDLGEAVVKRSIANSGAIMALPEMHVDTVRPGIMLYGVSPFPELTGQALGLMPVMRLMSEVCAIHHCPAFTRIGYGGMWHSDKPSIIGVVPVGYGDGYPRHLSKGTPVGVNGSIAQVVGRVSMDMLSIDVTHCPGVKEGCPVELWGEQIPIEQIAKSAGTIAYELMCQLTPRVRHSFYR